MAGEHKKTWLHAAKSLRRRLVLRLRSRLAIEKANDATGVKGGAVENEEGIWTAVSEMKLTCTLLVRNALKSWMRNRYVGSRRVVRSIVRLFKEA